LPPDIQSHFPKPFGHFRTTSRGDMHRDWGSMKAPVVLVTATLTFAILIAATLLVATGAHGVF
jgi:hypothetical protein